MRESGYYPPGAEFDPRAPWNQEEPEPREYQCDAYVTLRKTVPVSTKNYIVEPPEYPDYMGGVDLSDVIWENDYAEQYTDLGDLLERMAGLLVEWMPENVSKRQRHEVRGMIAEARGWVLAELEVNKIDT